MNLNLIFSLILLAFTLTSCSSSSEKPTTDVCTLEKHWRDNIFQVQINGEPINKNYYIHDEALEITKELAKRNKCM